MDGAWRRTTCKSRSLRGVASVLWRQTNPRGVGVPHVETPDMNSQRKSSRFPPRMLHGTLVNPEQITAVLFACLYFFVTGGAYALGQWPASHEIIDSGYFGRTSGAQDIYWLDNSRIIFIGYRPGEFRIENEQKMPRADLVVWNTTTRHITKHADVTTTSWLCSSRGFVQYGFIQGGIRYVRAGEFGKEHETEEDVRRLPPVELSAHSPISCRDYDPSELKKWYGSNPVPLLEPGEYLDRTHARGSETMRYFPGGGRSPISLSSIPTRSVMTMPRYSPYLDKYVFQELRFSIGPDIPHNLWLLDRRGEVTHMGIPVGPWMDGSVEVMPVVHGSVMRTKAIVVGRGVGAAGVYLVNGGKPRRLLVGAPYSMAASPDGCKVAVSVNTDWGTPSSQPRIMFINLCLGKN